MRHVFGHLADAGDLFGGEAFLPVVHVGAAVQFYRVDFLLRQLGWVFGTAGIQNRVADFVIEGQAEGLVQRFIPCNGVEGKVFVADNFEVGEQLEGRRGRSGRSSARAGQTVR